MANQNTLSDESARKTYNEWTKFVMSKNQLIRYGYPCRDPENPELRLASTDKLGSDRPILRSEFAPSYVCYRCSKEYKVNKDGIPLMTQGRCVYHPRRWVPYHGYTCCNGDLKSAPCANNTYHVHRGELELENYRGYVETKAKPEWDPDRHGVYALDCEMCYTTYGLELTRVTLVDHNYRVVYDKLVRPLHTILDYNTATSGISACDLVGVDTRLADVQRDLLEMFSNKTILVGHGMDSDMKALKMFHEHFIDTVQLFPHPKGLPYKMALRILAKEKLDITIQENKAGHDSKEDACVALKLVMWKANHKNCGAEILSFPS